MDWVVKAVPSMGHMCVVSCCPFFRLSSVTVPFLSDHANLLAVPVPEAFYGITDLLTVLPYYIEIALAQNKVRSPPHSPCER